MDYNLEREYGKAFLSDEKHWIYNLPGGLFQNVISHLVERVLEFAPDDATLSPGIQLPSQPYPEGETAQAIR
jgi:hypothetical protein